MFNAAAGAPSSRGDLVVFGTAGGVLRGLEAVLWALSSFDVSPTESDVVEGEEVVAEGAAVANVLGVVVVPEDVVAAGRAIAAAAAFSFSSSAFTAFNKNSI